MSTQTVINADCVDWMKNQQPNTIDAVVTDPPYGLEFMNTAWDTFAVRLPREVLSARRFAHLTSVERLRREDVTDKAQLVLLVYQEWTRQWALEAIRILKPGAYMLVMGGTRTHHRLTAGLEDAGFVIRDCLCWVYASGFPKSYDIAQGFDKRANKLVKTKGAGKGTTGDVYHEGTNVNFQERAKKWQGWGTALKPAWEPIVLVQKPLEGSYCDNVEKWGTGGLNIDECRIGCKDGEVDFTARQRQQADPRRRGWHGHVAIPGTDIQMFKEKGRFPANVQIDSKPEGLLDNGMQYLGGHRQIRTQPSKKGFLRGKVTAPSEDWRDSGGITRFFVIPKASPKERGDANKHPTVKPIRLFKQMIKLITPPGGVIVDPFVGSGTACLAAEELGFDCIGIDNNEEYCNIARQRLNERG